MEIELIKNRYKEVKDNPRIGDIFVRDKTHLHIPFYGIILDTSRRDTVRVSWYHKDTNTLHSSNKYTLRAILSSGYTLYRDSLLKSENKTKDKTGESKDGNRTN